MIAADDWMEPRPTVGGMITVNLDHEIGQTGFDLGRADRHALETLIAVPDGANVRVLVGSRKILSSSGIYELALAARRLKIRIDAADTKTVEWWSHAIATGVI